MKKLLAILLQPPIPQIVGLLILSAVIYFGGQALRAWLGWSDSTLLIIVAAVWVLAILVWVWRRIQANKRARMIEDRLRGQAREHREAMRPDKRSQVEELEKGLDTALGALRSSKLGKSALYQLPWYVIIGPPGSGKTTLLKESNLSFPDEVHGRGMRGMGGTRNCDWWFTDQAILLDTAGRYTTQDEDRNEWFAFLDMLKKARSQKPINGALITISITDILQANDTQLAEHAQKVRDRIAELTDRLEVVFPVYLMFSKCDLLAGFIDTFGSFDQLQRAQVWGVTTPFQSGGGQSLKDRFDAEFDSLLRSVSSHRLERLAATKSLHKKTRVFSFPLQFAAVRARVRTFLEQIEQSNTFQESSSLRGLYFTSGTQEGQPLDQVLSEMRTASGLTIEEESQVEDAPTKKAYFIDDLFTDVVFHDKDLAHSSAKAERRRALTRKVGAAASIAATIAMIVWLFASYARHASLIADAERICNAAKNFAPERDGGKDLEIEDSLHEGAGGPFEQLRALFERLDDDHRSVGSFLMGQTNAMFEDRVRPLYIKKLKATFLQPLHDRLAGELQGTLDARKKLSAAEREQGLPKPQAADFSHALTAYRRLSGTPPLKKAWLLDYMKQGDRWSWREGKPSPASLLHRATFLDRIFAPSVKGWSCQKTESLVENATTLANLSDKTKIEIDRAMAAAGKDKKKSLRDLFKNSEHWALLDPSSAVTEAFQKNVSMTTEMTDASDMVDGETPEARQKRTEETFNDMAAEAWEQALIELRPLPKPFLPDAMAVVTKLTGEGSIYVTIYKEVCEQLRARGWEVEAGETDWMVEVLVQIGSLEKQVSDLCDGTETYSRLRPEAMKAAPNKLTDLKSAFVGIRKEIRNQVLNKVSSELQPATEAALNGLVQSLEWALAQEIVEETKKHYLREGLARTLTKWSRQFPFNASATETVDTVEFNRVFRDQGKFDQAKEWIERFDEILAALDEAEMTTDFAADIVLAERIKRTMFANGQETASCDVTFFMEKGADMESSVFTLDGKDLKARSPATETFTWQPNMSARISIQKYRHFAQGESRVIPVDEASIKGEGSWGLLKLLSLPRVAVPGKRDDLDGFDWEFVEWSPFLHPQGNYELQNKKGVKSKAKLHYRTEGQDNPLRLQPAFFHHKFAEEVFRANKR